MIRWPGPAKAEEGGRFKVSMDDDAPLPRGIACATRGISATLNGGLMMDSRPLWDPTTILHCTESHYTALKINSIQFYIYSMGNFGLGICFVFLQILALLFRNVLFGARMQLISRR